MKTLRRWWSALRARLSGARVGGYVAPGVDPATGLPFDAPRDLRRAAALRALGESCGGMLRQAQRDRQTWEAVKDFVQFAGQHPYPTPAGALRALRKILETP